MVNMCVIISTREMRLKMLFDLIAELVAISLWKKIVGSSESRQTWINLVQNLVLKS